MPGKSSARGSLSTIAVADLHREIARRGRIASKLAPKREALLKQLRDLDAQIGEHHAPSSAPETPRRAAQATKGKQDRQGKPSKSAKVARTVRGTNKVSLVDALSTALQGKTLSIGEAIDAVRKAGYKSASPNFRTMVNIALIKKDRFKRVTKGRYTAV